MTDKIKPEHLQRIAFVYLGTALPRPARTMEDLHRRPPRTLPLSQHPNQSSLFDTTKS